VTSALVDSEERRRIREDLGATFFVEAAAGTGKTTALVSRVLAVLASGAGTLDRIVAVTFTDKAAGEMKLRLRSEIEALRNDPACGASVKTRLDDSLEKLEVARIVTIHAFCGDLLHERPVEAGVDPLFEVAGPDVSDQLLEEAFDDWFQRALADPPEGMRRVLRRRALGPGALSPRRQLRNAAANLLQHRDFPAPWTRAAFDRDAEMDELVEELRELGAYAGRALDPDDWLAKSFAEIARFTDELDLRERVRGRDHDGLEAELRSFSRPRFWGWRGRGRFYGKDLPRGDMLARRDAAKERLVAFIEACDADLAPLLREELREVVEGYGRSKQASGRLDFLDLLIRTRDLLRDEDDVRADLQQRFSHFFVDEFQDTDPLQAEILLLLSADRPDETDSTRVRPAAGKLFLVGDPKQSIYRFRRADVSFYEATKERLVARGAEVLQLRSSFRALPAIQEAVNAAFAPYMRGPDQQTGQARYEALEPARKSAGPPVNVVALPVPEPYGDYGSIVKFRIEDSLPHAVGGFVDWLVNESGWTIVDGDGNEVRIRAKHVCVLFRRMKQFQSDVTRPYVRALESRRIPHVLVGGRSFHDREEVQAIRNALCAVEWPDDALRVFATLRGALFALGDDALLAFRHRFGGLHPLKRFEAGELEQMSEAEREVADSLDLLGSLHQRRNHRPLAATLAQLLGAVRAHAGIAIWPTGEQALANCLRLFDLARRFERRGAISFRAFAEFLEDEAERHDAEEAPAVEEGTEGVRIMTVHRAKGLEFPVVILADPTCNATQRPSRYADAGRGLFAESLCGSTPRDVLDHAAEELAHEEAEAVRVAYVAATRARDLLVVPVVGDESLGLDSSPDAGAQLQPPSPEPLQGWLDPLRAVVFPRDDARRETQEAPACPPFGGDSVLRRPPRARAGTSSSVVPGLHVPARGAHRVVWWDPATLILDREADVGLRQEKILVADEGGVAAEEGIRAHAEWQARRQETRGLAAQESLRALPVTTLVRDPSSRSALELSGEVLHLEVAGRGERPAGRRFGALVHAALAVATLGASDARDREQAARAQGRLLGASEDEVAAAARALGSALAHPILVRAAAAAGRGELRRETPLLLELDDGTLAEGIVDLAFREDGEWTVVDFKTDVDPEERKEEYEAQLRLYLAAITRATGEAARGVLLSV